MAEESYEQRRFKRLVCEPDVILTLLKWRDTAFIEVLTLPETPIETHVASVSYSHELEAFVFLLHSAEWPIVPRGEVIPELETEAWTAGIRQGADGKWGVVEGNNTEENLLTPELTCGDCKDFAPDGISKKKDMMNCDKTCHAVGRFVSSDSAACVKIMQVEPAEQ